MDRRHRLRPLVTVTGGSGVGRVARRSRAGRSGDTADRAARDRRHRRRRGPLAAGATATVVTLTVADPALRWSRGYDEQPLYPLEGDPVRARRGGARHLATADRLPVDPSGHRRRRARVGVHARGQRRTGLRPWGQLWSRAGPRRAGWLVERPWSRLRIGYMALRLTLCQPRTMTASAAVSNDTPVSAARRRSLM